MSQPIIQHSFHAGEWAPALNARVDLAKYHSAAALLRNYYVDYRGGASSRPGTRYVDTAVKSATAVRLIPFQASTTVGYVLEFGDLYMRPIFNGATLGFTLNTPYLAADLALLKFTQSVDKLYICHPNYPPSILQLITATNWTLTPIQFGSTVGTPTGLTAGTTNAGTGHYGYCVTAIDFNGQESSPSTVAYSTINVAAGQVSTINLSWTAVTGAQSYNVYRTPESIGADPPTGSSLGYLMNVTAVHADDTFTSNSPQNAVDFSLTPPIAKNPFQGAGLASVTVTAPGSYTTVPSATVAAAPAGGITATVQPAVGALSVAVFASGSGFSVGQIAITTLGEVPTVTVLITSVDGFGGVLTANVLNPGALTSGTVTANPVLFGVTGNNFSVNVSWGIVAVNVINAGTGYTSVPAITFSAGAATATAVLQMSTGGNPSVPGLHQQRLVLAAKPLAVQTFNMSQPGSYYNFNIRSPIQPDDAIEASIVSGQLNSIKSMASVPTGLILMTDKANWLISAGGQGAAVTPIDIVANAHSFDGASDVPLIIANFDILFVQSKGSIVRDLTFNFYTQIYTGTDITVLSSHLFYGFQILEWAWAEEPFKVVWAVRNDGVALTLTFLKEQELLGWAHSDTQGLFKSVAVVTEQTSFGLVDAVYFVVERVINGATVKYIERLAERIFPNGAQDAWCVDAGIQYDGPPATTFTGATHLANATVTGLADGVPITPFVMPLSGTFTLPAPASKVTVGLSFTPQLQTLPLDTGEPTIQGKRKSIGGITVRVEDTLGLAIGKSFSSTVPMKDLVLGNVGSATNMIVTGLVTADARTIIDPSWDVPGQYCINQPFPLPSTILGVMPEIEVGDTK
jgi:hypothetical protein